MTASVLWIESPSWELDFYGLPHRFPWPADADPEAAHRSPLDLEPLLEAIDRLGPDAGEPWTGFRAATGLFEELSEALEEGEIVRTLRLLEEIERLHPGSPFVLFQQGNLARLAGQNDEALQFYRRVLEKAPRTAPAWSSLGALLAEKGDRPQAVDAFRKALEMNGNDQQALNGLVSLRELVRLMRQSKDGQPDPQSVGYVDLPTFRQMISSQIETLSEEPAQLLALAEQLLGDGLLPEVALSALETARDRQPEDPRTQLLLGSTYRSLERFEDARRCMQRLTEIAPQEAVAHMHLAQACNSIGDAEGEHQALQTVLQLDPNFHAAIGIYFNLSNSEHNPAKEEEIARWSAERNSWMGFLLASSIARTRGDAATALRHADQAFGIAPQQEEVLLHLSAVLGESKELGRLTTQIRPAVESGRFSQRLDWNYAQTLYELGLRDEACGVLRRALGAQDLPEDFKSMATATLEAWSGLLSASGVPLEISPSGHLTRPVLISLSDGDGGIVIGAGRRLPAQGSFPWKPKGSPTVEITLQQGESGGNTPPKSAGTFRAADVQSSTDKPVECHVSVTSQGQLHFRATQDGRRLPVAWKPPETA
jgi:tetratricopeptide (TPR) repeat protein